MTPAQKLAELRAALDTSDTLECVESLHDDSGSTVEYMHLREVGSKAFHSSPLGMYPPMAELAAFAANNAAAIAARERKLLEPIPSAYGCQGCGRKDGLDAVVSNDVWESIRGPHNLLCLWCIDFRCMSHGIKTSASLHFCGKSITGTSQSEADQEHISRLCDQLAAKDEEIAKLRDLLDHLANTGARSIAMVSESSPDHAPTQGLAFKDLADAHAFGRALVALGKYYQEREESEANDER